MGNGDLLKDISFRIVIIIPVMILFYLFKILMENKKHQKDLFYISKKQKRDILNGLIIFLTSFFYYIS